ncbi:nuclear transport factor 2 family protein [Thalassotalea psychrophila]|uniref:Nuclear transport factor 2 family protein n=1 Tax=Thalassotalea psychrophila TaxID=3065647 RepID=A0ABY9U075_9GAMM|nr:nuclear transport factor 2 family protein [Colwelliaceae bacterium SQ149]
MSTLENRIKHLEDLEAIRHLKHYYYCHCVDRAVDGDSEAINETISRFTDNIVADFTGMPLTEGKEAVGAFYAQGVPGFLSWCQHRVSNEVINIDGDRATASWYIDCPATFKAGNPVGIEGSGYIAGQYKEQYVKENGIWKWARITALLDVQSSFEQNWQSAKQITTNR